MSAVNKYNKEFVRRTKEILENEYKNFQKKDREVTFLMNCLLGLIIAVSENSKESATPLKNNINEEFLKYIPEKVGFIINGRKALEHAQDLTNMDNTKIESKIGHKKELSDEAILFLITKLRNGIAHQHIKVVENNKQWTGVKIWNMYNEIKDFEIEFTIEELKNLAIKIAEIYLPAPKNKSKRKG